MKLAKDTVFLSCLAVVLAVLSVVTILILREVNQNQVQVGRFANYMRCLIVVEDEAVIAVGEEAYVLECEKQLRGE